MRIAKPILMVTTPIGLLEGFYECYKLAGGLLFLMVAMVGVVGAAMATVVATIRREAKADALRQEAKAATVRGEAKADTMGHESKV
jgi:hypothetical protein